MLLDDNSTALVYVKSLGGGFYQRVGGSAERHYHGIGGNVKFASLDRYRAASAALVRLAKLHADAPHGAHKAVLRVALVVRVFKAQHLGGVAEEAEFHPLLTGVLYLLAAGGQLLFGAAVYYRDLFRSQSQRGARGIHCHIAAADHGYRAALHYRGGGILAVCLHKVGAGQVFVCRINALKLLAGYTHEHGQSGARADIYRLKALGEQLVHRKGLAYYDICHELYAECGKAFNLARHDAFGQTEFRDAVYQHAAGGVQCLKNGDLKARLCQIAGAGQPRGT